MGTKTLGNDYYASGTSILNILNALPQSLKQLDFKDKLALTT